VRLMMCCDCTIVFILRIQVRDNDFDVPLTFDVTMWRTNALTTVFRLPCSSTPWCRKGIGLDVSMCILWGVLYIYISFLHVPECLGAVRDALSLET
jgi:hypothetical protein